MPRSCVAGAVCALLLLCLGSSARAASSADPSGGALCSVRELPAEGFSSLAALASVPEPAPAVGEREGQAPPAAACAGAADPSGQCAIDGPIGSGSDPRPAPRHVFHSACLATAQGFGTAPLRALPRTDAPDARVSKGYARGIERPPRTP